MKSMSHTSDFAISISNFEKEINNIFDCDEKINSISSVLDSIRFQMDMVEHLSRAIQKTLPISPKE